MHAISSHVNHHVEHKERVGKEKWRHGNPEDWMNSLGVFQSNNVLGPWDLSDLNPLASTPQPGPVNWKHTDGNC